MIKQVWHKLKLIPFSIFGFLQKEYSLIIRKKRYLYLSLLIPLIIGLIYVFTLTGSANRLDVIVTRDTSQSYAG